MEWRGVKTIIILLLLLVNGFLLALVWGRRIEAAAYDRTALTQAVQVLSASGIEVDADALAPADSLDTLSIERDTAREDKLVSILLGETVTGDNRGGGLYLYRGESGEVSFRTGGEISATLNDDVRWYTVDPAVHAEELLREMGLEAELTAQTEEGDETTVTYRQLWEGVPLFSCTVAFTYRDGQLRSISGTLLVSDTVTRETGTTLTQPSTLLRFMDGILERGDVCSEILSMETGYRSSQSSSGVTRLSPIWLISSNTADYYLDATTGALERISDG